MGNTMGLDMSMRSTGIVVLSPDDDLLWFDVFKTRKDEIPAKKPKWEMGIWFPDPEDHIITMSEAVSSWIDNWSVDNFVIEKLTFSRQSAYKDFIAGIYWGIRSHIRKENPHVLIGSIAVNSWRSKVLTPDEAKEAKATLSPKNEALKIATVAKLPDHIRRKFTLWIKQMNFDPKTIYDLSDAYFLTKFRNSLK
jgi:hypothetical protein